MHVLDVEASMNVSVGRGPDQRVDIPGSVDRPVMGGRADGRPDVSGLFERAWNITTPEVDDLAGRLLFHCHRGGVDCLRF